MNNVYWYISCKCLILDFIIHLGKIVIKRRISRLLLLYRKVHISCAILFYLISSCPIKCLHNVYLILYSRSLFQKITFLYEVNFIKYFCSKLQPACTLTRSPSSYYRPPLFGWLYKKENNCIPYILYLYCSFDN